MVELSERRKADRAKMADQIEALVAEFGYTCRRDLALSGPKSIHLDIETERGLCVWLEFDGKSTQPDIHVVPWHIRGQHGVKLADIFGPVNQFHRQKATCVAYGWSMLLLHMRSRLELIKSGEAFL